MITPEGKSIEIMITIDPAAAKEEARATCWSDRHVPVASCFALAVVPPGEKWGNCLTGRQIDIMKERLRSHREHAVSGLDNGESHQAVGAFTLFSEDRALLVASLFEKENITISRMK